MVVDKPLHTSLETGEAVNDLRLERFDGEKGNKTDHGTNLEVVLFSVGKMEQVVVETIFFIPEGDAVGAEIVHRVSDVDEVLEELAGDIFIGRIFFCEFERDRQHVEAIHAHPTCAVGLFEMATSRKRRGPIKNPDVV